MRRVILACAGTAVLSSIAVVAQAPPAQPAARQGAKPYTPPRTPWGDPDLQGKWPGIELVGVPMQRDPRFGTRNVLTDEEFKVEQARREKQALQDEAEFDLDAATSTPGGDVGGPVSPPPHWLERGGKETRWSWRPRTSAASRRGSASTAAASATLTPSR